jgi:hypothetical protein
LLSIATCAATCRGHPALTLHATEKGGHMVHESHADVIARWLNGE